MSKVPDFARKSNGAKSNCGLCDFRGSVFALWVANYDASTPSLTSILSLGDSTRCFGLRLVDKN